MLSASLNKTFPSFLVPTNRKCWLLTPFGSSQDNDRSTGSITWLYEIDFKRQIKLLQTFITLLVSDLRVRRLDIVSMQPIFTLDGPALCLPWQIVTLPTDVDSVGTVETAVLVVADVSGFQMSPYSLWSSLTGVVGSSEDEMNDTLRSQCKFMAELVVDRL